MFTTTSEAFQNRLPVWGIPLQPIDPAYKAPSPSDKTAISRDMKQLSKTISQTFSKIANVATNLFSGIRSLHDLVDPRHNFFSKKFTTLIYFTSGADILLAPSALVAAVNDLCCLFTLNSIMEKIDALLSFITDSTDLILDSAAILSVLHELRVISETAIRWIRSFYVASFFVGFIDLGRSCVSCKRIYSWAKKLSHDLDAFRNQNVSAKRTELSLAMLRNLLLEKEVLAEDLFLSKKALQKRIDSLSKLLLGQDPKVSEDVDSLLVILSQRAKVQSSLAVIDLVNSIVFSAGSFMAFFPPLIIPSTMIMGATGVVSFFTWGVSSHFISKNPFGPDILPSVAALQA